jgi:Smg protein
LTCSLTAATCVGFASAQQCACRHGAGRAAFDTQTLFDVYAMNNTVFDILIYVFDRYLLEELAAAERGDLARDLESAGFEEANVERALDWLADLADERERPAPRSDGSFRVYGPEELSRLDVRCRGLLTSLEQAGILSGSQRELVIDRLLALDTDELDLDHVKWVVLMVLSSQPGQEVAYARMEDLVFDVSAHEPH